MSSELVLTFFCVAMPMLVGAFIVLGIFVVYWYYSWFNPPKLREIEIRRIQKWAWLSLWPQEWLIARAESTGWLWTVRLTTSVGLLMTIGFLLLLILDK